MHWQLITLLPRGRAAHRKERLPFQDESFELVLAHSSAFCPTEGYWILRPGSLLLTAQGVPSTPPTLADVLGGPIPAWAKEGQKRYNRYKCDNCDNRDKPDWKDTRHRSGGVCAAGGPLDNHGFHRRALPGAPLSAAPTDQARGGVHRPGPLPVARDAQTSREVTLVAKEARGRLPLFQHLSASYLCAGYF